MTRDEAERITKCHCAEFRLTRRQQSNKVWISTKQCVVCGRSVGTVKKGPFFDKLPLWDDNLANLRSAAYAVLHESRQAEWQRERDAESEEFWQRYDVALASPHWRNLQMKVWRRCNGICEGCADRSASHLHHLTYDRLGKELLIDVVYLCVPCHELIHNRPIGNLPIATIKGVSRG